MVTLILEFCGNELDKSPFWKILAVPEDTEKCDFGSHDHYKGPHGIQLNEIQRRNATKKYGSFLNNICTG